jgi:GNAT superfamily N-acetyltransferase
MTIHRVELPAPGIEELRAEAFTEGFDFIERLIKEWSSGENRFDAPGEILCGYLDQGRVVAVGGLNRDPFVALPDIGRIRRVYARPGWRHQGVGRSLVTVLIEHARQNFRCVRLRADNPNAARLYESIGFLPCSNANATHTLTLTAER